MDYYRNPLNGNLLVHDAETNSFKELLPLFVDDEFTISSLTKKRAYTKKAQTPHARKRGRPAGATSRLKKTEADGFLLGEEDYASIKSMQGEELTSIEVREELEHIPLQCVNWAFQSPSYRDYQRVSNK